MKRCRHKRTQARGASETCLDCGAWRGRVTTSRRSRWRQPAPVAVPVAVETLRAWRDDERIPADVRMQIALHIIDAAAP